MMAPYPDDSRERDRWILAHRGPRPQHDVWGPPAFFIEEERAESGEVVPVLTALLTSRDCPWHCLMCDLWRYTTPARVPPGAIPSQIDQMLRHYTVHPPPAVPRQIKLYNGGSFFDPGAVPLEDYEAIARQMHGFDRVIVESHPALVGPRTLQFRDRLRAARVPVLEIAMGLETANPVVLEKLNKGLTIDQFRRAADLLQLEGIALRVFILVKPPFLEEAAALHWAERSLDLAFEVGATAASLIPTRPGNGALEALAVTGDFAPPRLATLEAALTYGLGLGAGRVFADLWDLEQFSRCATCFVARKNRLNQMNLGQTVAPPLACASCGGSG